MRCALHIENPCGSRLIARANLVLFAVSFMLFFGVAKDAMGSAGLVQAAAASGTASTLSVSLPQNTVAGDIIVVGFDFTSNASPSLVTDSQGNTFTQVGTLLTSPVGAESAVYYANDIKGGADTVTVNLTASSPYLEVYITEYTGIDPTNPIDAQTGASGLAGPVSSGNATTTAAGDVIYGYCVGDWACTAGSGFTTRSTFRDNLIEDETAGAPGTYAATGSANNGWTMHMVALKPASTATMAAPVVTSPTTANGTAGSAFSYQITATNGPTSYAATGLPSGLSLGNSGWITGTPTVAGTWTVTLSATNSGGTGYATLTITAVSSASLVQVTANHAAGTANALSVSLPQNTVAGDIIVVGFDFTSNASPSLVTDSQGNTFTQVGTLLTSPVGAESAVYYANDIKGGADTVTVNLTASSPYLEVYITEYTGIDPTNPIDAQTGASGLAGPVSSGNATTTAAGDVIYGYCVGDWACTAGSGFTTRSTFRDNLIEDETAGAPGTYAATGSANNGWTMHMVALKPASPAATATVTGLPLVSLSNTSLTLASGILGIASPTQSVSVTNTGFGPLIISSIAITGTNATEFSEVNTCAQPLALGGNCVIAVLFTPLLSGAGTASLTITDNASGSPQTVSLAGSVGHYVTLSWNGSATPGVVGYNIYRGTGSGGESSTPLNSTPINGTEYNDQNVSAGATYYYVVTSVASNGVTQSAASNEAVASVP